MLDESSGSAHRRLRGDSAPGSGDRRRAGNCRTRGVATAAMLGGSTRRAHKLAAGDHLSGSSDAARDAATATMSTSGSSAVDDDFAKTASTVSTISSTASSLSSRVSALQSLRLTLRKHKTPRSPVATTGTSDVTVYNEDEEEESAGGSRRQRFESHLDEEEDIAILQPEEDEPASPEKRVRRWRRSISSMRHALSRASSSSTASAGGSPAPESGSAPSLSLPSLRRRKKAAPAMYSISFYPWKRDPRAYYSNPEAAAEWVPDTASRRCQICLAAFHLTRRRHHCRLCGLLACNDCSQQRTYFPFAKGARSQHHLIKDGAPQRTCNACAGTLKNMAAQHDPRVKRVTPDARVVADPFAMRDDGDDAPCGAFDDRGHFSYAGSSSADDEIYVVERSGRRQALALAPCLGGAAAPVPSDELDEVLRARARSRKSPHPKFFVVSSAWLEQWLQYVHVDAPPAGRKPRRAAPRHVRRPGPIANYALLNFVSGKLVPKDGLARSRGNDAGGDYRVVSEDVWGVFVRLYGGGPCIQLREDGAGGPSSRELQLPGAAGPADTGRWLIVELDDSIPALVAAEPADLLKGNKNMRRAASASALGKPGKHLSSVHPFHETAPCVLGDAPAERRERRLARHDTTACILSDASGRAPPPPKRSQVQQLAAAVSVGTDERAGGSAAAVAAFAAAAAEARKKSALSLSRHSSALSSSMVKASATTA